MIKENHLKLLRKEKGFSQVQLAHYLGVNQSQIAKLENGSRIKFTNIKNT